MATLWFTVELHDVPDTVVERLDRDWQFLNETDRESELIELLELQKKVANRTVVGRAQMYAGSGN